MFTAKPTRSYKKSFRRIASSGDKKVQVEIEVAITKLMRGQKLDKKYRDHSLTGELKSYQECHIRPNLLLIYKISGGDLVLYDVGSHSELFG